MDMLSDEVPYPPLASLTTMVAQAVSNASPGLGWAGRVGTWSCNVSTPRLDLPAADIHPNKRSTGWKCCSSL